MTIRSAASTLGTTSRNSRRPLLLRGAVTMLLLTVLATSVDWRELGRQLTGANPWWFLAAVATYLLSQAISSLRWRGLGRAVGIDGSPARYLMIYLQGAFFGLCLPSSIGGDVVKAYRIADRAADRILAGCTVLADRLTGLTALLAWGAVGLLCTAGWEIGVALASVGIAWCIVAASLCMLIRTPFRWDRLFARLPVKLRHFTSRLAPYGRRPRVLVWAALWSIPVQLFNIGAVVLVGQALGLYIALSTYFVVVPVTCLVATLPLSLAGVGLREGGIVAALAWYGYTEPGALALGLSWSGVVYLSGLVGGLAFLCDFSAPTLRQLATEHQSNQQPAVTNALELAAD